MQPAIEVNPYNPLHGVNATRVIQALVRKGRTLETLREKPRVQFKKDELEGMSSFEKSGNQITNQFVNRVVQLVLNGNKLLLIMFRNAQLDTVGLRAKINNRQPAVIDLAGLGMYTHGSAVIGAKSIRFNKDTAVKPEVLKPGSKETIPLQLRWGITRDKNNELYCANGPTRYVPNQDFSMWTLSSPVVFSDEPPVGDPKQIEKPVEMDGVVLKGLDGGKRLEISSNGNFVGKKGIILPFFSKGLGEVRFIKLHLE